MSPRMRLHYGSGVFEGMRCYQTVSGSAVFRLDAHLDRLYNSASVYGMEIPYQRIELAEAICEVVERNEFSSCYVRSALLLRQQHSWSPSSQMPG